MSPRTGLDTLEGMLAASSVPTPPSPRHQKDEPPSTPRWMTSAFWEVRDSVTVVALTALTVIMAALNIAGFPRFHEDEGTYTSQAWAVTQGGITPYTYWYDHPFLGWVQMAVASAFPRLLGHSGGEILDARLGMLIFSAASAPLLFLLARRVGLSRPFAAGTVALWALSPLSALYNRQVFLDLVALPWLLLSFVLALSPRRNLAAHIGAGVAFAVACLSKETVVVLLPALVWMLWRNSDTRTRSFSIAGFTTLFVCIAASYPLFAALRGELFAGPDHVSIQDALAFQFGREGQPGSILDPSTPKGQVVSYWWTFDHVGLLAGALAAVVITFGPRPALRPLGIIPLIGAAMLAREGWLPGMFIVTFLPFMALCVVGVAHIVWRLARDRQRAVVRRSLTAVVALGLAGAAASVAPVWAATYSEDFSRDENVHIRQASEWVANNLDRDQVVMTDNAIWPELVDSGWESPFGVLWHVKLDTDSSAQEALPGGARDIDYIVSTYQLRSDVGPLGPGLPQAAEALENSTLIETFGEGEFRIEIRKVNA